MENKIISPCISICRTDPVTGYCYGCARTNDEKRNWKDENTSEEWKIKNKWKVSCGIVDKESLVVNGKPITKFSKKEFKLETCLKSRCKFSRSLYERRNRN